MMTRYAIEFIGMFGGLAVAVLGGWLMSKTNKAVMIAGFIIFTLGLAVCLLATFVTFLDEWRGMP